MKYTHRPARRLELLVSSLKSKSLIAMGVLMAVGVMGAAMARASTVTLQPITGADPAYVAANGPVHDASPNNWPFSSDGNQSFDQISQALGFLTSSYLVQFDKASQSSYTNATGSAILSITPFESTTYDEFDDDGPSGPDLPNPEAALNVYQLTSSWVSGTDTLPTYSPTPIASFAGPVTSFAPISFDVTTAVDSWINLGTPNCGFVVQWDPTQISDTDSDWLFFGPAEGFEQPSLTFNATAVVPEPSSLVLIGLAMGGMLFRRRSKA